MFGSIAVMALALVVMRLELSMPQAQQAAVTAGASNAITVAATDDAEAARTRAIGEVATPRGTLTALIIEDIKTGIGRAAAAGDTLTVHYIGRTSEGFEFDNSHRRGEPFTFTLGENRVIEGWETGLVGMQEGGERILVVPPHQAYGNRQVGPVPAGSTLVFAVELLAIE